MSELRNSVLPAWEVDSSLVKRKHSCADRGNLGYSTVLSQQTLFLEEVCQYLSFLACTQGAVTAPTSGGPQEKQLHSRKRLKTTMWLPLCMDIRMLVHFTSGM